MWDRWEPVELLDPDWDGDAGRPTRLSLGPSRSPTEATGSVPARDVFAPVPIPDGAKPQDLPLVIAYERSQVESSDGRVSLTGSAWWSETVSLEYGDLVADAVQRSSDIIVDCGAVEGCAEVLREAYEERFGDHFFFT